MKKIIKLTEYDLVNIVKKVLTEQKQSYNPKNLKFGDIGNDVRELQQKLFDDGFLKTKAMKTTGFFGNLTNLALAKAEGRPAPKKLDTSKYTKLISQYNNTQKVNNTQKPKPVSPSNELKISTKQYCPAHPKSADVNPNLEKNYQTEAAKLIGNGIPTRTSCEISFIKLRPKFSNKSFFVFDGSQNLIYLFDKTGNFVAKSYVLDGADAQSQDTEKIAQALWTWQQQVESLGFKWDPKMQKYLDKTNKNRTYSNDLIYNAIDKNDTRFFPKGVYSIAGLSTDNEYAGGQDNLFRVETLDGKKIAQAIHGFYNEAPRVAALEELKNKMGKSASPKSAAVPQEFLNMVEKYKSTQKFNKSYGCINLPTDFLKIAKPYAVGAMLFVIGETQNNYLVQNADTFFQKMGNAENCSNPTSLGIELPNLEMTA
jgi:hypothetical protein